MSFAFFGGGGESGNRNLGQVGYLPLDSEETGEGSCTDAWARPAEGKGCFQSEEVENSEGGLTLVASSFAAGLGPYGDAQKGGISQHRMLV